MLQENLGYTSSGWVSSVDHGKDGEVGNDEYINVGYNGTDGNETTADAQEQYATFEEEYEAMGL